MWSHSFEIKQKSYGDFDDLCNIKKCNVELLIAHGIIDNVIILINNTSDYALNLSIIYYMHNCTTTCSPCLQSTFVHDTLL